MQIFRPGMLQRLQENKSFEDDLLQALAHDEFKVYYQPIADTITREIYGYEALVRWFHPVRGAVPPTVFIPVAEKIGLINTLGEWVLKTACAEAASWATPLKVSVNVSPIQLMNTSLTDTIIGVLQQTGLDPRRLDLEITESDVFNENTRSLEILSQLREQGIQISIDDFGTGYSSLSRLSYFPFDKIKIDRSFVINIPEQKRRFGYRSPDYQYGKESAYAYCGGRRGNRRAVDLAAGAGGATWSRVFNRQAESAALTNF